MQLLLVEVAAAFKKASQEPPSSAHVRTHLTTCLSLSIITRLPRVINAPLATVFNPLPASIVSSAAKIRPLSGITRIHAEIQASIG
jgi:hypothetical protein